jgi:thiol-disulfide isomerase/thioredoxin
MGKRRAEVTDLNSETADQWEHLKLQSGLIVVDVYTKWAGPCDIMKPVIIKIKLKVRICGES